MSTLSTVKAEVRRLLSDLDERAYSEAEGDGVTTAFPLPDQNIVGRTTVLPYTPLGTAPVTVHEFVNPPYPAVLYVQGNLASVTGNIVVTGTDWLGDTITETVVASSTTPVPTTNKYREVTSVELPVYAVLGDMVRIYAEHSMACTIDAVATTAFTADFDTGWVEFDAAPDSGSEIIWSYHYHLYSEAELLSAINNAVADIWAEVPQTTLDDTTIIPASDTTEYNLPHDCLRLIRVEKRGASGPWQKENNWRVIESGGQKVLKLFTAPSLSDTIRLHYVAEPLTFANDTDTLSAVGLPERAKWALIYLTCFYLCEGSLLPRIRTNQFKNAEGVNVPKLYEIQRVTSDFKALADLEIRKVRLGVKRW